MPHQIARVLRILQLLQANGRMSGAELAQRLEVDVRTVRRYIALLEDIGIHVTAERGRHGAYALGARFKLPPLMFTPTKRWQSLSGWLLYAAWVSRKPFQQLPMLRRRWNGSCRPI